MKKIVILAIALSLCSTSSFAVDAGSLKRAADKSSNWLIEQFNLKLSSFGSGPNAQSPEQSAMVLKALCEAPRDYKEASGPFITEPLKLLLSKINADGSLKDSTMQENEALQWIVSALKATGNPKYGDTIESLRARAKQAPKPQLPEFDPSQLSPENTDAANLRNALFAAHMLFEKNQNEVMLDGKSVKWSEVLGAALLKLQKPNGSFGDDIPAKAMALSALEWCWKNLK